jgi:predicted alpha/beta hydrolase family esterase
LAKYLSENKINKKIISAFIIAPPFDDSLPLEDLVWWFELQDNLELIEKNSPNTRFIFSWDDPVIPLNHSEKYKNKLKNTTFITYNKGRGHFQMEEFPEIIDFIKNDIKNYYQK